MSTDQSLPHLTRVSLDRLHYDPDQPRTIIDDEDLTELSRSMDTLGRTAQLVTVRPDPNGDYIVVSGERRVRAARQLGWSSLPVMLEESNGDPIARLCAQVAENVARADLSPAELCDAIARLRDAGMAAPDVAEATGMSRRSAYNYFRILDHPEHAERLRAGETLRAVLRSLAEADDAAAVADEPETDAGVVSRRRIRQFRRSVDALVTAWPDLPDDDRQELQTQLGALLHDADTQGALFTP